MLVLTRRPGEQIVIDNNIRITVVSVGPGRVKIGIEAPPAVRIDRQEIHTKIQQEQSAVKSSDPASTCTDQPADHSTPIIVAASDESGHDAPKVHNRISGQLPVQLLPTSGNQTASGPMLPLTPTSGTANRLQKHRFPRKPR